jgi:DNA-binding winged helix-turn-helix (wHTH) protein
MEDKGQNSSSEHLTQKDIVQLLLHNAQHMVTREELKSDINEVKDEIVKIETSLKQDISKIDDKLSKVDAKFDKIQWLIIATMLTILLKVCNNN